MRKVSFVIDKFYHNNLVFNKHKEINSVANLEKYHVLQDEFKSNGYEIATNDIHKPRESDVVLYLDMPHDLPKIEDRDKSFLLAIESSIIKPENFDLTKHKYFHKVFTWNDDLVDDKKYIKINYSFSFPQSIYKQPQRKKLCCLIVSNKNSSIPNELYSERKELIRWFEKEHPDDFDLYGFGWNEFRFTGNKLIRVLNKIPFLRTIGNNIFGEKHLSYKGKINSKFETMRDYRFAIAYENVKDEAGYITEKIFDVFIAGCIPIYWGARNVARYIPSNCFIDRRDFKNNEELYDYMKSMDNTKYIKYLDNIELYLSSEKAEQFSANKFAKTIVHSCLKSD